MPMKYCDSVRQTVEVCLRAGVTGAQIARELKLNEQWVSKLNVNLHCFGTVSPAHPSVQGRPRQIPFEAEQGILEFIDQNPTCYQDEIVDFLLTEYGISVHRTTVSRVLKKLNQTHKRIERLFPEASDVARAQFRSKMAEYKANQIVFLDESAATCLPVPVPGGSMAAILARSTQVERLRIEQGPREDQRILAAKKGYLQGAVEAEFDCARAGQVC